MKESKRNILEFLVLDIFRVFISVISFVALLPISDQGYEKGCAVAVSIFLISKIIDTAQIIIYHKLNKFLFWTIIVDIILSATGLYISWTENLFKNYIECVLVLLYVGALYLMFWDFYTLNRQINDIMAIDEIQNQKLGERKK